MVKGTHRMPPPSCEEDFKMVVNMVKGTHRPSLLPPSCEEDLKMVVHMVN